MFEKLKRALGLGRAKEADSRGPSGERADAKTTKASGKFEFSNLRWLPPDKTWFGLEALDLRPYSLSMMSLTRDRRMAENSVSYGALDGREFIGQPLDVSRTTTCELRYPCDPKLGEGRMFKPDSMDYKWAVYFYGGEILFIRSWLAKVAIMAKTRRDGNELVVTSVTDSAIGSGESDRGESYDPSVSIRWVDYLIRTLCMGIKMPCPLPTWLARDPEHIAHYCWAHYGKHGETATYGDTTKIPERTVLRCVGELEMAIQRNDNRRAVELMDSGAAIDSLSAHDAITPLHAAAAMQNVPMIRELVRRGADLEAKSQSGLSPLLYALANVGEQLAPIEALLDLGANVNSRSGDGSSGLQFVVQSRNVAATRLLLERGADPNIASDRGFIPLHSAAEMGEEELCRLLLEAGSRVDLVALGFTPRALAEKRGHPRIAAMIGERGG